MTSIFVTTAHALAPYLGDFFAGCKKFELSPTFVDFGPSWARDAMSLRTFFWYCRQYRDLRPEDPRCKYHSNYRWQVERFAWKVYAITSDNIPDADWRIWLDADTIITAKPDLSFLDPKADVVYLGRKGWHHSETGFVAYNMRRGGPNALVRMRHMYETFEVFEQSEWHDAWIFDICRQGLNCQNISSAAPELDAWSHSPLAAWSRHLKGDEKFDRSPGDGATPA